MNGGGGAGQHTASMCTAHGRVWYAALRAEELRLASGEASSFEALAARVSAGARSKEHVVVEKNGIHNDKDLCEFMAKEQNIREPMDNV